MCHLVEQNRKTKVAEKLKPDEFQSFRAVVCATFCDTAVCIAYFCRTHYIFVIMGKTKTWFIDQYYTKDHPHQEVWLPYQQGANAL